MAYKHSVKKLINYTLVLVFLLLSSGLTLYAQTTSDSLKPKMKMVKEVLYKPENGEIKSREDLFDSELNSYKKYDKNEKIVETGQYETDGSVYEKTFYERDEKGKALKAIQKNASGQLSNEQTRKLSKWLGILNRKLEDLNFAATLSNTTDFVDSLNSEESGQTMSSAGQWISSLRDVVSLTLEWDEHLAQDIEVQLKARSHNCIKALKP